MKKLSLFIAVLSVLPALLFAGGKTEVSGVPAMVDGVIEYLEGSVTVNNETADFGMKIPYGAIVKTGPESYCEIVFDSKNLFRVMGSTVATIKLSVNDPEILIEKGALGAFFAKLDSFKSDEPFKIRTQTTLAGIRGTAFFVKAVDAETTYVCICNGEIELSESDGSNSADFSSGHHKAAWYRGKEGDIEISSAPLLYHNDEDMNKLADRIGEKIPWDDNYNTEY